ncbi:MAG: glycosyltransferase family 2 protein [Solirubrobacterales bacterium]
MPEAAAEPVPTYSWVVPVLNEEDVLPELHRRLSETAEKLDGPSEFILVDDGSIDRSREVVLQLRDRDPRLKLVALSRNFGHQLAITAGIDVARGDAVVVMDSDLQDPPEVVVEMAARWREGFDLVHGVRTARRGEGAFKRHTAHLFYRLLNRASDVDLPLDTGDFRLLDRRVADVVRRMREPNRYLRGLFAWVGFRQTGVQYERDERYAGDTKFSLMRMLSFAVDGLTGFSTVPLRLALGLGLAISALAFAAGLAAVVLKLTGAYTISGWASVTVMITFFSGVQLLMLGAVGQYVGRIFEQGKARPLYLIAETHGIEEPAGATGPGPGTTAAARGQER